MQENKMLFRAIVQSGAIQQRKKAQKKNIRIERRRQMPFV